MIEKHYKNKAEIFFDELILSPSQKFLDFTPKDVKKNFFTKDNLSIYEALSIADLVIGLSSTPSILCS